MTGEPLASLVRELGNAVDTSAAALAAAAADSWPLTIKQREIGIAHLPDAVVRPEDAEGVAVLLQWAAVNGVPVTPRGAGSAVTGAPIPDRGGVVLDLLGLDSILEIDEHDLVVRCGAGVMGGQLEEELAGRGLSTGFSPQSLHRSTVGGWVATRATGQLSSRYGGIEDAIVGLTAVLATGELVEWRPAPRWTAGPDLRQILIGSEGTLAVITEVALRLHPLAEASVLDAVSFASLDAGLETMRAVVRCGLRPSVVRLYDPAEGSHLLGEPTERSTLLLACEGEKGVAAAERAAAQRLWRAHGGSPLGPAPVERWLGRRYDFRPVERILGRPGGYAETIEVAARWSRARETYAAMTAALAPHVDTVWGHFSHVYPQGTSLYVIALGQAADDRAACERLHAIWEAAMEACLTAGASIVHHHGVGLARLPWLARELGSTQVMLERLKSALDPAGVLAPGKLGLG